MIRYLLACTLAASAGLLVTQLATAADTPATAATAAQPSTAIPAARATPGAAGATAKPATPEKIAEDAKAAAATAKTNSAAAAATADKAAAQKPAAATAAAPDKKAKKADAGTDKPEDAPVAEAPAKPVPLKPPVCMVAEFRAIGMDTSDIQLRRSKALAWIKKKGKDCTAEQLLVMRNNRSQWLGTADSASVAASIDGLLEAFAVTNREVSILLYGTPPPPPKPPEDKNKAAKPK